MLCFVSSLGWFLVIIHDEHTLFLSFCGWFSNDQHIITLSKVFHGFAIITG